MGFTYNGAVRPTTVAVKDGEATLLVSEEVKQLAVAFDVSPWLVEDDLKQSGSLEQTATNILEGTVTTPYPMEPVCEFGGFLAALLGSDWPPVYPPPPSVLVSFSKECSSWSPDGANPGFTIDGVHTRLMAIRDFLQMEVRNLYPNPDPNPCFDCTLY